MKYWLCVTNEKNWEIMRMKNIWGVPKSRRYTIQNVKKGDKLVVYLKEERVDNNSNVSTNTLLRHTHDNKDAIDQLTQEMIDNYGDIPLTTDDLLEGSTNLYFTQDRVNQNSI